MSEVRSTEIAQKELLGKFTDEFNPLVELGQRIGATALNGVLDVLGGLKPHIPTQDNFWQGLQRVVRDEEIRVKFNGNNYEQLAIDYELDPRQVRRIVNTQTKTYRTPEKLKAVKVGPQHHALIDEYARQFGSSHHAVLDALLSIALEAGDVDERLRRHLGVVDNADIFAVG